MRSLLLCLVVAVAAQDAPACPSLGSELEKLSALFKDGLLSEVEFAHAKEAAILQSRTPSSARLPREKKAIAPRPTSKRLLQTSGNALADVSLHLKASAAKMCLGPSADACLGRTDTNLLATSGGLTIGSVDAMVCTDARKGTLRWLGDKAALQVCNGAKWKAAGGAVLDAADEEPCNAETPGPS